tara:strand:- start:19839 stop:20480 length:642 start_codon:yes stop_codon:yes gene_type:complete
MIVGIIDYGSGNIRSVYKSFEKAASVLSFPIQVKIVSYADQLNNVDKIVLPGQGAFSDCMKNLKSKENMINFLNKKVINEKKEFLGICVGMQLLAKESSEHGYCEGLSWLNGKVKKMKPLNKNMKIPHMGWNSIFYKENHSLFKNIKKEEDFYFVHSYEFVSCEKENILASTTYGGTVIAAVVKDNIVGTQFHPEKSQKAGMQFIKNFIEWKA